MRYEDRTVNPFSEEILSLSQLKRLLKEQTGRDLVTRFAWDQCCRYFALVRMPAPLGFLIVANCDIKKNTILPCSYGGEKLAPAKEKLMANSEFLQEIQYENGQDSDFFQAEKFGDFGALFAHLPDRASLEAHQFRPEDIALFQLENCQIAIAHSGEVVFITTNDIQKGAIIGQNYGENYWLTLRARTSPILFYQNTLNPVDLSQYSFSVVCGARNHDGDFLVGRDGRFCFPVLGGGLEARCTEMLNATSGTIALDGDHHFSGHFLRFPKSNMLLDAVVTGKDFEEKFGEQVDLTTNKPKGLFFFSTARAVVSGCNPPPGSTVDKEGRTVVPKVNF